eukprot:m.148062 g.148062  ORF g.148062 m.148062 type:complete len:168 (-) comp23188_c0_seq4:183-686(-)
MASPTPIGNAHLPTLANNVRKLYDDVGSKDFWNRPTCASSSDTCLAMVRRRQIEIGGNQQQILSETCSRLNFVVDMVKTLDPERHVAQAESSAERAAAAARLADLDAKKAGAAAEVAHAAAPILAELKAMSTELNSMNTELKETRAELKTVERRLEEAIEKSCCTVM